MDDTAMQPVSPGPRGRFGNNLWEAYSARIGRMVTCYSDLEYDHWVWVESDPRVQRHCEQPRRIRVATPDGPVESIFDGWIQWQDGAEEYREVKYAREVADAQEHPESRVGRQLRAQAQWCAQHDIPYRVITDQDLQPHRLLLANWKRLLPYLVPAMQRDITAVQEAVWSCVRSPIPWGGVIDALTPRFGADPIRAALSRLLHHGHLQAPLDRMPVGPSLIVERRTPAHASR